MADDVIFTNINADNTPYMGATVHVTKTGKVSRLVDEHMPTIADSGVIYNTLKDRFDNPTYYG